MLKLRNAVLTALLAFCLAMPFVSCSFNDGATGDVSDKVTLQSGNNQNGGNGGSTGGNGGSTGGNGGSTGGNEKPDEGTEYTVMYNGSPVTYPDGEPITFIGDQDDISYEAESLGLDASDYTIEGTYIILNEAGNAKVQQMFDSHGNI